MAPTDNEYVRRVGFALSFSGVNPLAKRSNSFAWLPVLMAVGIAGIALLACLR